MRKPRVDLFEGKCFMEKAEIQWDKGMPGLGIRLNRNGTMHYIAKLSLRGRPKWYTVGSLDLITREQCRKLVGRMKLLARSGEDPEFLLKAFFKAEDLEASSDITFGEFIVKYIEDYAKIYRKSWLKDQQRLNRYLKKRWGSRKLKDITREDFIAVFKGMKKTPVAANRLKETTTTVWKQAMVMGHLKFGHPLPTFQVKPYKTYPRREKIPLIDIPKLAELIKSSDEDPIFKSALLFILYTACRHGEVITMKWSYFNFEQKIMTIPLTKNDKPHILPLSDPLIRLLKQIPHTNEWVFPSKIKPGKHISALSKPWQRIRRGHFDHITIHSLRRSVGCIILEQTGSLSAVRDMLNHTNEHVSAIYGFYDTKALIPIVEKVNEAIEKAWSA